MEIKKSDWKLFRERIGDWQEEYMEKLCKEYVSLLESDEPASSRFWEMEKRIKEDKRNPGVRLRLVKSDIDIDLMRLIRLGVISKEDLEGFSDELVERVTVLVEAKF